MTAAAMEAAPVEAAAMEAAAMEPAAMEPATVATATMKAAGCGCFSRGDNHEGQCGQARNARSRYVSHR